jgi:hypothetical protein
MSQRAKRDEYYTLRETVDRELAHYDADLAGKRILCNTNDGPESRFMQWAADNADRLHLRSVTGVSYCPDVDTIFGGEGGTRWDLKDGGFVPTPLSGTGSFDCPEALNMLSTCDVILGNPPFSLWDDWFRAVDHSGKGFLAIGSLNMTLNHAVLPAFVEGRCWLGVTADNHTAFRIPNDYDFDVDSVMTGEREGSRAVALNGIRWFTNLPSGLAGKGLDMHTGVAYDPGLHPYFDGTHIINCDSKNLIPDDYDGPMGVPINVMDSLSPAPHAAFELLGSVNGGVGPYDLAKSMVNGEAKYKRACIRRR